MIINQLIGRQFHVLQVSQEFKQRITRSRHQNFIARIRQQAHDVRITFAGAGGQHYGVGIHLGRVRPCAVIAGDCRSRTQQPSRLGIVIKRTWITQRLKDRLRVVSESGAGRIRQRQIKHLTSRGQHFSLRLGKGIRLQSPIRAAGKSIGGRFCELSHSGATYRLASAYANPQCGP